MSEEPKKKRAYTSLLSVLQVMEKKSLLTHDRRGLAHVYRPLVSDDQILRPFLQELTHNVFGRSPARVMQFLLEGGQVSPEELSEMRSLLSRLDSGPAGAPDKRDES